MKEKDSFLPIDIRTLGSKSGNIYKSINIIGRHAKQLTVELKEELTQKLAEFAPAYDNLEEVMENKEQIEISKFYERLPNAVIIAMEEFKNDQLNYRYKDSRKQYDRDRY